MALTLELGVPASLNSGDPSVALQVNFPQNARWYRIRTGNNTIYLLEVGGTDGASVDGGDMEALAANADHERDVPGANGRSRNLDATTRAIWIATDVAGTITCYDSDRP